MSRNDTHVLVASEQQHESAAGVIPHQPETTGSVARVFNTSRQPHDVDRLDAIPFLVVEDDPASARLVSIVLATEGATDVRVAHSAEEALAVLRDNVIRVLIVDLLLPGMDGLAFVRKVKGEAATRHIIAIAISGWDGARLASDAIDSGCIAFVPKPIEFDTLLAIVRASLVQAADTTGEAEHHKEGSMSLRGSGAVASPDTMPRARVRRELLD